MDASVSFTPLSLNESDIYLCLCVDANLSARPFFTACTDDPVPILMFEISQCGRDLCHLVLWSYLHLALRVGFRVWTREEIDNDTLLFLRI